MLYSHLMLNLSCQVPVLLYTGDYPASSPDTRGAHPQKRFWQRHFSQRTRVCRVHRRLPRVTPWTDAAAPFSPSDYLHSASSPSQHAQAKRLPPLLLVIPPIFDPVFSWWHVENLTDLLMDDLQAECKTRLHPRLSSSSDGRYQHASLYITCRSINSSTKSFALRNGFIVGRVCVQSRKLELRCVRRERDGGSEKWSARADGEKDWRLGEGERGRRGWVDNDDSV